MSSMSAVPSSLGGIKRLAKSIKRELLVPHHAAPDLAAQRAAFNNIRDAQRRLGGAEPASRFEAFLTAYWRNRVAPHGAGRETLRFELTKPLGELIARHEVATARNLQAFKLEFTDHLECRFDVESQDRAREALIAAARTLRFLAATGLRPATTRKQLADIKLQALPQRDHVSTWVDPTSGSTVKLDEPYKEPDELIEKRRPWLEEHGLLMMAPAWEGLYSPGYSHPYFILRDETLSKRLRAGVEGLAKLPDIAWTGGSANYLERFVSPARQAQGRAASRRTMPAYPGTVRAGAVAYGGRPGEKGRWRPAEPMPVALHDRASVLLQNLSASELSERAYGCVQQVRSELEDWVYGEHRNVARSRDDLYYGGQSACLEGKELHSALMELIAIIRQGYRECAPRRRLLIKLDQALAAL